MNCAGIVRCKERGGNKGQQSVPHSFSSSPSSSLSGKCALIPSSLIFFLSVLRLIPRRFAARTWLPSVFLSTSDERLLHPLKHHGVDVAAIEPAHAVDEVRQLFFEKILKGDRNAVARPEYLGRQGVGEYLIALRE